MLQMLAAAVALPLFGSPAVSLTEIAADPIPYIWPAAAAATEHQTAVGPVVATNGTTTVVISQVGRYSGDAAAAMAFSTFYQGRLVDNALLPGLTSIQNPASPYDRITFETISWNARYNEFIVAMLPISNADDGAGDGDTTLPPVVMRSHDGINWTPPVPVASGGLRPEKSWIACDNSRFSKYYGNCYVAWDDNNNGDLLHLNTSKDGGVTWGPTVSAADGHSAYGALPVIQPNGNIVITSEDSNGYDGGGQNIISFVSTDGGASVGPAYEVSPITAHTVAAFMRTQSLPTTAVDPTGTVYTIWQDCRFRSGCFANDLVLSVSRNGINWSNPVHVNIGSETSSYDHFLPSLALRNSFLGWTFGLSYYAFSQANCTVATCQLFANFSYSGNAREWSQPEVLTPPMNVTQLASTSAGYMVGDYFTSVFPNDYVAPITIGLPATAFAYNEAIFLPQQRGLLGPQAARTASSTNGGLSVPDSQALHQGGVTAAFGAARRAPKTIIHRSHHPM